MGIFTYYAIFVGLGVGAFFIGLGLFWIIGLFGLLFGVLDDIEEDTGLGIVIVMTVVLTSILPSYITHHLLEIKYPEKPIDITTQIYNNNKDLEELTLQINLLTKALENPQELTLKQIENILSNSLKMKILIFQNDSIISLLKNEIEIERQNAEESRQIAENLKSLTKEQIEAITSIITKDAKEASKNSFIKGVLVSIPIGFLVSFLASFVFKRWGEKMKNSINKK